MQRVRVVVDVWSVPTEARPTPDQRSGLDAAERERAAALPSPASERFVLGRVLLRAALAARWSCSPGEVVLHATCPVCGGAHGRVVALPGPGGERPPHLSVTRAGPVVAVALSADAPVGIDAESCAAVGALPVADVALSPAEHAAWGARGRVGRVGRPGRRERDLARAWVRKEATLKALGTGLTRAPAAVELRRAPRDVRGVDAVATGGVAVADLRLGAGRVGAVAVVAPELAGPSGPARGRGSGLVVRRYDGVELLAARRR